MVFLILACLIIAWFLLHKINSLGENTYTLISPGGAENYIHRKEPGVIEISYYNGSRYSCRIYIDCHKDEYALKKLNNHLLKANGTGEIRHYPNKKLGLFEESATLK